MPVLPVKENAYEVPREFSSNYSRLGTTVVTICAQKYFAGTIDYAAVFAMAVVLPLGFSANTGATLHNFSLIFLKISVDGGAKRKNDFDHLWRLGISSLYSNSLLQSEVTSLPRTQACLLGIFCIQRLLPLSFLRIVEAMLRASHARNPYGEGGLWDYPRNTADH